MPCLAVYASPTSRQLCARHLADEQLVSQIAELATHPALRSVFKRLLQLTPQAQQSIFDFAKLDDQDMQTLSLALHGRGLLTLLRHAVRSSDILAAMQIAIRDVRAPALGLAILEARGAAGWLARTAARFL